MVWEIPVLRRVSPRAALDTVPPDVARKLVDTLFGRTSLVASAIVFSTLAALGLIATGSRWYLAGLAYTVTVACWRYWQTCVYARAPESATPVDWAWRAIRSGWATAAGWGAWGAVVAFEPQRNLAILAVGMTAALTTGAASRNCGLPSLATGQIYLASFPMFLGCLMSGNSYLYVYAVVILLYLEAALAHAKALHEQTLLLLMREHEKTFLVERLELANQELEALNRDLTAEAMTDALTLVANRRAFDLISLREWRRSARERTPMSMLLLDIDHFKAFNDFYGHQAGDMCLQQVAAAIGSVLTRPGDVIARYGGEEFAVILPETDLAGVVAVGEQILRALAAVPLPHDASPLGRVSVSIGAACFLPSPDSSADGLVAAADAALYSAKRGGRNRLHAAESVASAVPVG